MAQPTVAARAQAAGGARVGSYVRGVAISTHIDTWLSHAVSSSTRHEALVTRLSRTRALLSSLKFSHVSVYVSSVCASVWLSHCLPALALSVSPVCGVCRVNCTRFDVYRQRTLCATAACASVIL